MPSGLPQAPPLSPHRPPSPSPPPPPPAPLLPPLPPGGRYQGAVAFAVILEGSVSDVSVAAATSGLSAALAESGVFVAPEQISLSIEAASVRVTGLILAASLLTAEEVVAVLPPLFATPPRAAQAFGLPLLSVPERPLLSYQVLPAPSPPPSSPSPHAPPLAPAPSPPPEHVELTLTLTADAAATAITPDLQLRLARRYADALGLNANDVEVQVAPAEGGATFTVELHVSLPPPIAEEAKVSPRPLPSRTPLRPRPHRPPFTL